MTERTGQKREHPSLKDGIANWFAKSVEMMVRDDFFVKRRSDCDGGCEETRRGKD